MKTATLKREITARRRDAAPDQSHDPITYRTRSTMNELTLTRPDDWHLHLRDGAVLGPLVSHTARQFGRAIVMPNLKPPVTTTEAALAYRQRILSALPAGLKFEPLMTLYLTDQLHPDEVRLAYNSGLVRAIKYYPAGATTNSESGVTQIEKTYPRSEERRVGKECRIRWWR